MKAVQQVLCAPGQEDRKAVDLERTSNGKMNVWDLSVQGVCH